MAIRAYACMHILLHTLRRAVSNDLACSRYVWMATGHAHRPQWECLCIQKRIIKKFYFEHFLRQCVAPRAFSFARKHTGDTI